jgi:acyl carrier protein
MQQHEIEQKVYSVIAKQFAVQEADISPDWSLRDYLGADSMVLIELMVNLEEVFEAEMPEVAEDEITTVGHVVQFIQERLASESRKR